MAFRKPKRKNAVYGKPFRQTIESGIVGRWGEKCGFITFKLLSRKKPKRRQFQNLKIRLRTRLSLRYQRKTQRTFARYQREYRRSWRASFRGFRSGDGQNLGSKIRAGLDW